MAGIGEASAVIGVAQVGLSLASALNTYISDVSNARDDILSLIGDIEATSRQLADLQQLITRNETTKAWNENGLRNAQKCVTDCEKTIAKLRKLLRKSSISNSDSEPVGEVNRDDIDITKFQQAMWPWYKPQLEVHRRELQGAKQDILIAYSTYMIKTGTSAEREKYKGDLPQLHRARELIRGQLREAKVCRVRREQELRNRSVSMNEPRRRTRFRKPSRDTYYDDGVYPLPDGQSDVDIADVENLEDLFEQWQDAKEEEIKIQEEKRKEIEIKAVEEFKTQQLLALEARRQKVKEARAKLLAELTKAQMPPQRANEIVNNIHSLDTIDKEVQIFGATPAEERALNTKPATSVMTEGGQSVSSRRWTLWPRRFLTIAEEKLDRADLKNHSSGHGRSFSAASTLGHELQKEDIPPLLQDPTSEGGIAPLEAYFFQRTNKYYVPRVEIINFEVPNQWLLLSVIKKQDDLVKKPTKTHSVWREFSFLPADYREQIAEHLHSKNTPLESSKWVLLHVEPLWEERRRSIFHRRAKSVDISGVYVVFKRNRHPGDVRHNDHGLPHKDRISFVDPPTRSRTRSYTNTREPILSRARGSSYLRSRDPTSKYEEEDDAIVRPKSPSRSQYIRRSRRDDDDDRTIEIIDNAREQYTNTYTEVEPYEEIVIPDRRDYRRRSISRRGIQGGEGRIPLTIRRSDESRERYPRVSSRRRYSPLRRQQLLQRNEPPSDIAETLREISDSSSSSLSDDDEGDLGPLTLLGETEEQLQQKILNKYVDLGEPKAADDAPQPANEDHDDTLLASPESNGSAKKESKTNEGAKYPSSSAVRYTVKAESVVDEGDMLLSSSAGHHTGMVEEALDREDESSSFYASFSTPVMETTTNENKSNSRA
ncbi:hypothetical protein DTO164E3_7272 [Paecilomyces variotii]|nr:hypothetical protein DTO164E3_7272 [Paecilomyces variotii]KAJ9198167.1 hypothetical protein DTO032I3_5583 [Paecilomyces variotii]KAJ9275908.1 hypothetical protein DTO021D3_7218 [Paecilomyces variotii]KAJ9344617.1 hypothetical protein DTO027B6_2799 [Paecilomyces variotii]KAJ9362489.1 hypothetical protein DTO027B9_166 [Paecilomyces variotii]